MFPRSWVAMLVTGATMTLFFSIIPKDDHLISQAPTHTPSWPIFITSNALVILLRQLADSLLPSSTKVMDDYFGLYRSQIIYACVRLEISKFLDEGPKSAKELSRLCGVSDETLLSRLLHAAESFGYFRYDREDRSWSNTAYSTVLQKHNPSGVANLISHLQEDTYEAWGFLSDSIQNDECPFESLYGGDLWEYFDRLPENEVQFVNAMAEVDVMCWYGQVHDFNWGDYTRVIDIGGGIGSFLAHILDAYPQLKGALYDRAPVIEQAVGIWADQYSGLQSRVTLSSGSFLVADSLPTLREQGDIILMRNIFHDWNDTMTVSILRALRAAIGTKNVTLAAVEMMPSEREWVPYRLMFDLHMHVVVHGKERYRQEWEALFDKSGFHLVSVVTTRSLSYVLVAKPVTGSE